MEDNISTKWKFSDRRHIQRRHDRGSNSAIEWSLHDKNKRRCERRYNPRRECERQNISAEVLYFEQRGEAINISSTGIYFEVPTNAKETLSPGTTIPLQINTAIIDSNKKMKLKFTCRGLVVRDCIIENLDHENSLGIAARFMDGLDLIVPKNY